jgi:hypothetical protein
LRLPRAATFPPLLIREEKHEQITAPGRCGGRLLLACSAVHAQAENGNEPSASAQPDQSLPNKEGVIDMLLMMFAPDPDIENRPPSPPPPPPSAFGVTL